MKDKIANSIVLHQMAINELQELKSVIEDSTGREVDFVVKTKHFDFINLCSYKRKNKLELSNYTINLLVDEAIKKERERIDKLIDMEVNKKLRK
ncbi:MAG: hypothetical protein K2P14_03620 [Anaeroplasmataceae bacterium]|nr:hypothetical protein [Anaeroplasmataceae bacterium]